MSTFVGVALALVFGIGLLALAGVLVWAATWVVNQILTRGKFVYRFLDFWAWRVRGAPHPKEVENARLRTAFRIMREELRGDIENLRLSQPGHIVITSLERKLSEIPEDL